ncbi:MAG: hypothetical protein EOM73_08860 [Bacteroidia bacterium]|nr:hypothetical protein [Bacteroidia bacterium]
MLKSLERMFALSEKGAKDFVRGTFCTTLLNISLMLPAVFIFLFLEQYLNKALKGTSRYSDTVSAAFTVTPPWAR